MPGTGPVRSIEIAPSRYLVVGDAPLRRFSEAAIARSLTDLAWVSRAAVAHEAVVESFLDAEALLPLKLFTIFSSDDRALAHVRADWPRIARHLTRVAGQVEWGVRLTHDGTRGIEAPRRSRQQTTPTGRTPSGKHYLLAKRQQRDAAATRARRARRQAASVYTALTAAASRATRRPPAATPPNGGRVVLDAAFLVATRRSASFRAAAAREARKIAPAGFALQLTGPWPPYSFVGDES